jgi:hypothetical protein
MEVPGDDIVSRSTVVFAGGIVLFHHFGLFHDLARNTASPHDEME